MRSKCFGTSFDAVARTNPLSCRSVFLAWTQGNVSQIGAYLAQKALRAES